MLQDSARLKLLVARLLELAKAENVTPTKETANLSDILEKLKGKFTSQGLEIEVPSQSNYQIKISPEILETALSNLMTNSLQHEATRIELNVRKNNHELVLDMQDNGPGNSPGEPGQSVHSLFYHQQGERRDRPGTPHRSNHARIPFR